MAISVANAFYISINKIMENLYRQIHNSFAVDDMGSVFIASDHAMYRFDAGEDGKPIISWREPYDRGTRIKPTNKSIIVENNYGYSGQQATMQGNATEPGMTRIDLNPDGSCDTVWNSSERVPNVVSKMSLANGLVYTYTKGPGPNTTDAWYFTAIDFETGQTVYKRLTGTGVYYDSFYAGVYLGPDGTAYVGVLGGLVAIRDQK
ncbi:hypothetical protein [Candidatus Methanoperedens nitratireducens]|uniref:Uncharacterized protein n=1 Tax=Candidatus Methanoperedens nitratireducens TaxID=1392998 RepID=A0A284VQH7_9EURY|nr:hypothetical protein [Candidatus Methanoperedens nitroreducens]SNQ61468.1 hypothetical protein MNV_370010 [Candidatus Methanoperedens nitroreducens]